MKHSNLRKTKTIRLSRIKIPPDMHLTPPGAEKMKRKYLYYLKHGKFDSTIAVDHSYILKDGYTTYLLAKMFGQKKIRVLMPADPQMARKKENTREDLR